MLIPDSLRNDEESEEDKKLRANFPIDKVIGLSVISSFYDADAEKIKIKSIELISYKRRACIIQVTYA